MPTKRPSLFGTQYKEPPKEKKPTLLQYLKVKKDVVFPLYARVELIWLPGTFSNYTLETPEFRYSVNNHHPLYRLFEGPTWREIADAQSAILLSVVDSKGTIELCESNVFGVYESIGSIGLKFSPTEGAN